MMNTLIILFSIYILISVFAVYNNAMHASRSYKIASRSLELREQEEKRAVIIYNLHQAKMSFELEKQRIELEKKRQKEKKRAKKS